MPKAEKAKKAEGKHKCPRFSHCGYAKDHKSSVDRHAKNCGVPLHLREHRHPCTVAGCTFGTSESGNLKVHMMRKHPEPGQPKPFVCKWIGGKDKDGKPTPCSFDAVAKDDFDVHMRRHLHDNPFKCTEPECKSAFPSSGDLARHAHTHEPAGDHLHKCTWHAGATDGSECNFSTIRAGTFTVHGRIHTGDEDPNNACTIENCTFVATTPQKKQEVRIENALDAAGISYDREVTINFSCFATDGRFARLDFSMLRPDLNMIVILEVDETQHNAYTQSCECRRTLDILTAIRSSGLHGFAAESRALILRFNPNAFKVDNVTQSVPKKKREERLVALLQSSAQLEGCFTDGALFAQRYMFYSTVGGEAAVLKDPDYAADLRATVVASDV
jgi:hypothetical protein